ncbi:MAG: BON domain-containing protein [Chitinophagaceae bacterium]
MSKFNQLAIALLLITAVSCNNKPDDKQIQENVTKQLQENKNYAGVNSTVKDGIVTLNGMCEGDNCSTDIENNIKVVEGVQKVENNITKDNSTDLTMRTSVQSIITKYPGVQADVAAGVIALRGSIDRDNLQALMSDLSSLHPEKIDNQLVVN